MSCQRQKVAIGQGSYISGAGKKPEHVWHTMRQGYLRVKEVPKPNAKLGIQMKLIIPRGAKFSIYTFLKPLLDGKVSSFQSHNGEGLDGVVERLSVSLQQDPQFVRNALTDSSFAVLGTTRLVMPYRNSVQWYPADHRFVHIDISVERTSEGAWSHNREIFVVKERSQ